MKARSAFNLIVGLATLVGAVPLMAATGGGGDEQSGCISQCDPGAVCCSSSSSGVCCSYNAHQCCHSNITSCYTQSC